MNQTKYPLKMCIPPERASQPCLTLPNRQWHRLPDGSIEVVFNTSEQLAACIEVTKFLRDYEPKETDGTG